MGTKPFKIGGEMAEKNEHEVGNPPLKRVKIHCIRFVPFLEGVANFKFIFLAISALILNSLVPILQH